MNERDYLPFFIMKLIGFIVTCYQKINLKIIMTFPDEHLSSGFVHNNNVEISAKIIGKIFAIKRMLQDVLYKIQSSN